METEVRQKRRIRRTVKGLAAVLGGLLAAVLLLALLFPISYRVDVTMEGIGWQLGASATEDAVTIQIKGVYHHYLMRDDIFEGDVHIQGVDYTDDKAWSLLPVTLKEGYGELTWFSNSSRLESRHYGFIIADAGMRRVVVGRQGESFGQQGGYLITAPADNHNDAVAKTAVLLKKQFGWLQKIDVSGEYA
ncbi:MAG: hypothetical protein Q4G07_08470 [Oscillospiraceae bacterium]|nr:hypothetical protein [Oscillospiraceae bacterium]